MGIDRVIRNGTVVTARDSRKADLAIADGKIAAIGDGLTGAHEVDATGLYVLPGGIDPHCHIEQKSGMGQWNADSFETATRSAAMGGTTTVISFAAQHEGQRLSEVVAGYAARAERGASVDLAFHIIVSDTSVAHFEADLASLIAAGHRSLKIFTTYNIRLDDADILRVMTLARQAGALVCVHAENDALIQHAKSALLADGRTGPEHHAASHPRAAEIEAVGRLCRFAEYLDQPVMLFHISTAEAAETIRAARRNGAPVWAETCPHYLLMTEDVLRRNGLDGAKWMCSPPQRTEADQAALWQALQDGTLDLISSDHAPYRFDHTGKLAAGPDARFDQIANGLPGLETRLPLIFDTMVTQGRGTLQEFVRLTATAPARIYGLPGKGDLVPGMDADITLWDPVHKHIYGTNDLHDNVGYNPWAGHGVTGWPVQTYLRGTLVADRGTFLGAPGAGRWIDRSQSGEPA
ncbi:MAG: dihydropyrimidinase [Rhodobacter sp.]|nr:dihydropyrimidinase [Rhodobacter sp.]